jgi:hypothetical protein
LTELRQLLGHQESPFFKKMGEGLPRIVIYPGDDAQQAEARVYDFGSPEPIRVIPLNRKTCLRYSFNFLKLAMELRK